MARLPPHLRSFLRLQPGKPAVALGVRAALAVTVPFILARLLDFPQAGWTGLSGLLVTLADRGGSYRARAKTMGAVALLAPPIGGLAALAGGQIMLDAPLLMLGVFAGSFARCFGEAPGATGEKLAVIFVASLGAHAVGPDVALAREGMLLFGGLWAMLQALVLWPVHPYLPARRAVSRVYSSLADLSKEVARHTRMAAPASEWEQAAARHVSIRLQLEHARETLAATRLGRSDQPPRAEYLLRMLELSDPMLSTLFSIAQAMEAASSNPHLGRAREDVAKVCDGFALHAFSVAGVVRSPGLRSAAPLYPIRTLSPEARMALPRLVTQLLGRLSEYAAGALDAAMAMKRGRSTAPRGRVFDPAQPGGWKRLTQVARDHLRFDSVVLRHSLRASLVATAALIITRGLGLASGFWVVLSAIGILQPYTSSTEERALHRVVGTLLGGTLAAVLASGIQSTPVLLVVIALLTATSVSLLPLNFGAFQMLLTPDFLLLASLHQGDWTVARERALGVLIACVLALAGAWFLWPSFERHRFPDAASRLLRAAGRYLRKLSEVTSASDYEMRDARREVDLALINAEASFSRMTAEFRGSPRELEPAMVLLTYSRRLVDSAAALGEQRLASVRPKHLKETADTVGVNLEQLAHCLRECKLPPPIQPVPDPADVDDPVSGTLLHQTPRQLEILHGAVKKIASEEPTAPNCVETEGASPAQRRPRQWGRRSRESGFSA